MNVRFIDMFCGIGGFRYGLEKSNGQQQENAEISGCGVGVGDKGKQPNQPKKWRNHFTCVWSNDNDKYACRIYRKHYGEVCEADIRAVNADAIPEHDLLCAGFPCQSFSIAGKRKAMQDTRGTLFFEICRILRAKRTPYLFLENVKGLLSSDDGRTFQTILESLDELGYDCEWQVLNSKDFGVPQNRERVFIVGCLRGKPRPQVFPVGEDGEGIIEGEDETPDIRTLQGGGHSGGHHSGMSLIIDAYNQRLTDIPTAVRQNMQDGGSLIFKYGVMGENNKMWLENGKKKSRNFPQGQRVYSPNGISAQLNAQGGGWGAKTGLYEIAPSITTEMAHGTGFNQTPKVVKAIGQIRRLTPLECERLQSFPDGWTEGISDTQRYKCLGNAVTTNVITAIGQRLLEEISV